MQLLIGIDDTDNKESRGTGFNARQLGHLLTKEGCEVMNITRHQLFVHNDIPYTSQNSSACLNVIAKDIEKVKQLSLDFMRKAAAPRF
jgi:tRNA(Ile2) C34 agmatinyltransferase TiaS